MNARPTTTDEYLASVPPAARATLEKLRRTIKTSAPDAVEVMGYGLPGFKYRGKPLIYIGAAKNHCALYGPAVDEFREDLAGYDASKGTIRFPHDKPPPAALVKKLVKARMSAIEAPTKRGKIKRTSG